jgi:hypothetical protein
MRPSIHKNTLQKEKKKKREKVKETEKKAEKTASFAQNPLQGSLTSTQRRNVSF